MILGEVLLGCLTGIGSRLTGEALTRWLNDTDIVKLVNQSLAQAVDEHGHGLSSHAKGLPGDPTPPQVRVDSSALLSAWGRDVEIDPGAVDFAGLAPHVKDVVVIPGCDLPPQEHEALLARVLETASRVFRGNLPRVHPAFEQWVVNALEKLGDGVGSLEEDHAALLLGQQEHNVATESRLDKILTHVAPEEEEPEGVEEVEWRNPFEDVAGEEMNYEDVRHYFVGRHTELQTVCKEFDTVLEGQRGTGKTMILKYLSFEVQIQEWLDRRRGSAADFLTTAGNSIGVYCKLPHSVFDKSDLRSIEDVAHRSRVAEHRLTAHILFWLFETLKTVTQHVPLDGKEAERLADRANKLITIAGDSVPNSSDCSEVITGIQDVCENEAVLTDHYLASLAPSASPIRYTPYLTLEGALKPLLRLVRGFLGAEVPFFLLLDDFDVLDAYQQELIFAVAGKREFDLICFKYGVMVLGRKTHRAGPDHTYRPGDDFDWVSLDWVEGGLLSAYTEAAREIGQKRLELAGWKHTLAGLFAEWEHGKTVQEEVRAAMGQEWESIPAEKRPTQKKADYYGKYGNARYFQQLRQRGTVERYAGLDDLINVSSGIIRQFLEQCKLVVDDAHDQGWNPDDGKAISAELQNQRVRRYSRTFFDNINQAAGSGDDLLSDDLGVTSQEMATLVESLSDLFYARLHYPGHGEPEIITIAVKGEMTKPAQALLSVAVRESIVHAFSYPPKTSGGGPLPAYMLNRRLCPRRNLSARRMQGRIEMSAADVILASQDRRAIVSRFMPQDGAERTEKTGQRELPSEDDV